MISLRLPAKTGYDEVAIGDNHTYRRIATCLTLQEEIDRMPDETDSDKENLKDAIIELIKQYCMDNIYKGFDDDCKGEMLHYSLSDVHQKDMENIMVVIADKEEKGDTIYWRDSSRVMYEDYTVEEFKKLYTDAKIYKTINKLYSDGLEQVVLNAFKNDDVDAMREVRWGYELPADVRAEVDKQVITIEDISAEELAAYKEARDIEI